MVTMDEYFKKGEVYKNQSGSTVKIDWYDKNGEVQYTHNKQSQSATEKGLKNMLERNGYKKVNDIAMEYDPIMCMTVPKKANDAERLSDKNVNELREIAASLGADKSKLYGTSKQALIIIIDKLKRNSKANDAEPVTIRSASEHKEGNGEYFGYIQTKHPTLGTFYVSYCVTGRNKGKLRYDNYPWSDIGKLSGKQEDFIRNHESEYQKVARSRGSATINVKDKRTTDGITNISNHAASFISKCETAIKTATPENAEKLYMELQKERSKTLNNMNDVFNEVSKELTENRNKVMAAFQEVNNKLFKIYNKR